jgi:hypothetical protein
VPSAALPPHLRSSLRIPMSIRTLWYYLTSYSNALTALASLLGVVTAFLGVLVAAAYAFLTWRLAQAAKVQAEQATVLVESAKKQADAALVQAEASRKGAEAAVEQARVTRKIFEAGHRPYVEVWLDSGSFWTNPEFFRLHVKLKNHGPVPADIIKWQAVFRTGSETVGGFGPEDELLSVFPDREQTLEARVGADAPEGRPPGPMEIELNVRYRGAHDAEYVTNAIIRGQSHQWRLFTSHTD